MFSCAVLNAKTGGEAAAFQQPLSVLSDPRHCTAGMLKASVLHKPIDKHTAAYDIYISVHMIAETQKLKILSSSLMCNSVPPLQKYCSKSCESTATSTLNL